MAERDRQRRASPRLRFELGPPEQGWTAVWLEIDGRRAEFTASNTPAEPVDALIGALRGALLGHPARVRWPLEPGNAIFDFTPCAEGLRLVVSFVDRKGRAGDVAALECRGSPADIALPLWRGLRRFASRAPAPPHWPVPDSAAMAVLTELLRSAREA